MININNYNNLYNKKVRLLNCLTVGIIFVVLIIFIVFRNIKYEEFYINNGMVIDSNVVELMVNVDELNYVTTNDKLKINDNTFAYTIISISDVMFNNNYYYQKILLNIKLDKKSNIKNNILKIKIPLSKKTVSKYIKYKIGGFNEKN